MVEMTDLTGISSFRQEDIDDLFTDLKVLGQVRPCDRMSTRGAQMRIDTESALQPLWRWMQGESREATQRGIKRILSQVNAIIDLSMATPATEQKRQILHRIYHEMEDTVRGLDNLRTTYENDVTMTSGLSVHIENVERKRKQVAAHLGITPPARKKTSVWGQDSKTKSPGKK